MKPGRRIASSVRWLIIILRDADKKRRRKQNMTRARHAAIIFSSVLFLFFVFGVGRRQRCLPINDCSTCHSLAVASCIARARVQPKPNFVLIDFITFEIVYYSFLLVASLVTTTSMFDSHVQRRFHLHHIRPKTLASERAAAPCSAYIIFLRLVYVDDYRGGQSNFQHYRKINEQELIFHFCVRPKRRK